MKVLVCTSEYYPYFETGGISRVAANVTRNLSIRKLLCYKAADVFILLSILLEASATGKPSLETNVTGIPDIINHGKTGFLVNPNDFDSLYKYTKNILEDTEVEDELGRNSLYRVNKKFRWKTRIEQYKKLFKNVLKEEFN